MGTSKRGFARCAPSSSFLCFGWSRAGMACALGNTHSFRSSLFCAQRHISGLRDIGALLRRACPCPPVPARLHEIRCAFVTPGAIETFESDRMVYLVMKLCTGGDLRSRAPYTEKDAADIIIKASGCCLLSADFVLVGAGRGGGEGAFLLAHLRDSGAALDANGDFHRVNRACFACITSQIRAHFRGVITDSLHLVCNFSSSLHLQLDHEVQPG